MKKYLFLSLFAPALILFDSCSSTKFVAPEQTLAQICADSFPCKDSLVFIEVQVESPSDTIVRVVATDCPPSDSITTIYTVDTLLMPGKTFTVKKTVMVPNAIDSALRVAYHDLQTQYQKSIQDLKDCQSRTKEKAKPRSDWKVWLMAIGLLLIVVIQLFNRKKD